MGVSGASSSERPFRLFVSAGEASGDLHTANLLRALKEIGPVGEAEFAHGFFAP